MKKIFLISFLSSLLISSLYADKKNYIGLQYGLAINQFNIKHDNDKDKFSDKSNVSKLVLGQDLGDLNYLQIYYEQAKYSNNNLELFTKNQKQKEFGFEWIKKDIASNDLLPFAKIGVGIASMKLNELLSQKDEIYAFSLTIGAGIDLKTTDNLSFYIGVDYNYKKWENFKDTLNISEFKTTQNNIKPYLGLNLKF
ncbi:outer membrane protein [Arcobacter porcinus]|uniref:Outer membrane protein beta-barrel domain-containing protein n=1 Tax=Arcobacter porcinus TaxID=1935204 RepID=A0ABX2YI29_9BACT|nr:outer membrane beta-barrel protein [Arcobacter porcinus]OCL84528.1 hypothetical protein AAW29_00201 [Arcobacter porcinus]OCL93488.1 hypothetical protein AAX28_01031 [Arcobacter porcinus]